MIRYRKNCYHGDIPCCSIWLFNDETQEEKLIYTSDGKPCQTYRKWNSYRKPSIRETEEFISKEQAFIEMI